MNGILLPLYIAIWERHKKHHLAATVSCTLTQSQIHTSLPRYTQTEHEIHRQATDVMDWDLSVRGGPALKPIGNFGAMRAKDKIGSGLLGVEITDYGVGGRDFEGARRRVTCRAHSEN